MSLAKSEPGGALPPAALPAIVLAAGAATRMGRLKQLLPYRGETLLRHAIAQAREAGFADVFVVLGAQAKAVEGSLAGLAVTLVENPLWAAGMGTSLQAGLARVLASRPDVAGVAVLLADQPHVHAEQLRQMKSLFSGNTAEAVAAEYGGTLGVPALFGSGWFPALQQLAPDAGAGKLLNGGRPVIRFPLPEAAFDIDTPDDFETLASG